MSYLKKFKIYKLKIDQSFVRDIAIDADDRAIVKTIVQMAHGVGFITIAKRVETPAQWEFLRDICLAGHCPQIKFQNSSGRSRLNARFRLRMLLNFRSREKFGNSNYSSNRGRFIARVEAVPNQSPFRHSDHGKRDPVRSGRSIWQSVDRSM